MSIISSLKRLIFGTKNEPVEHAPMRALPEPEKTWFSTAGNTELTFSDGEKLSAQHRAETVLGEFNESLNVANLSKDRETREHRLKLPREKLIELKDLANRFPFVHLHNMQAVEACIIAVEAETLALPDNEMPDPGIENVSDVVQSEPLSSRRKKMQNPVMSDHDRQSANARHEQVALMCIQSCFRVVNESIVIARKSKNLETKLSRLGVARNRLKEAKKQASQFSLKVDGFDAAEAEINRIDDAIKTGTPTEITGMLQVDVNAEFSSASRNLLKEATALKREKKFFEACEKLREAYCADGAENLMIEDRLRLPMYLQLAGRNDEGWDELNRLNIRYLDQFSQPRIANQRRVFLQKEGNEKATNPVRSILQGENASKPLSSALGRTSVKMSELQNAPMPSWMADVSKGLEFCATLQLRTPLRVLLRHGELYLKNDGLQPQIVREPWEGIWLTALKTYEEIACGPDSTADSIDFFRHLDAGFAAVGRKAASDVGPILANDYLPFLIAVRRIVEANEPIEHRIEKLRATLATAGWQKFVTQRGPSHVSKSTGADWVVECFFSSLCWNDTQSADNSSGVTIAAGP